MVDSYKKEKSFQHLFKRNARQFVSQGLAVAKVLRVNFDHLSSEESSETAEPLSNVTDVHLPSAAVDLNRWKDFDQIVFELRGVSEDQKPKICQKVIAAQCLLDQIPDGLALLDTDGKILWNNPRLTKWFPKETLVGLNFYDAMDNPVFCGVDPDPLRTSVSHSKHVQASLQHKDQFFRLNAAPISDNDGEVVCLVVTLVDTTQATLERQKLQALHEAGIALADLTPQEIFEMEIDQRIELLKQNILYYTKDLLDFDVIEIRLIDQNSGQLVPLLSEGIDSDASKQPLYPHAENNGVTGYVVANGESYVCSDITKDPLYLDGLVGARSSLTVPLLYHDKVIGSFNVESPDVGAFSESDVQFLEAFARDVAVSLNTLELLVAQKNNAAQQSVEAIHSAVALPIDSILCDTVNVIEKYIGHDEAVADCLKSILKNARAIKSVIQKVGEKMAPAEAVPAGIHVIKRPALRGRRVLVIDADSQVRESAHLILEKYGCIVETASQGKESLLMMANCDPDTSYHAVIADIRLPDISGYEMLMKMKETCEDPPLILMTGFGYDPGHSIVKARQAGLRAGAILYKPFRLDQLLETVEATVGSRNMATAPEKF